jgi:hypothetical protein
MVTVDAVIRSLDKMREIYPFKDDDTAFCMIGSPLQCSDSVVCISTVDKETGIKVRLEKDATTEMKEE